jgi:putative ABC transport system permease protein
MLLETIRLALRSVLRNPLRSFLTLLGIVIGVAAVIAMITIGSGTTERVKEDIARLGSNLLVVSASRPTRGGGTSFTPRRLDQRDLDGLRRGLTDVTAVSGAAQRQQRIVFGPHNMVAEVSGTDAQYFVARDWDVALGRSFSEVEGTAGGNICVIGQTVRQELFGAGDPLGQTLRVNRMSCEIVGVLEAKGTTGFGQDQDAVVLMPLSTFQRRIAGNRDLGAIYVSARDGVSTERVASEIEDIMRQTRRIAPDQEDNFVVRDMTQVAETMASATGVMTGMLGALAGVSLLVGGIGIMNIMLVSVTERTREIGLRLSVGARDSDVLMQFLVEAIVLGLAGGAMGIALGFAASHLITQIMEWPAVVSSTAVMIAFGFSAGIGIFFGYYPAQKAAALDPIEALRFE